MKLTKQGVAMTETKQKTKLQPSSWFRKIVTGSSQMTPVSLQVQTEFVSL